MYDYQQLKITLQNMADEKHRNFHLKLVPNVTTSVLGIPVHRLRKLAKKILEECKNPEEYFGCVGNEFYEEIMLWGIVIGYRKCDWHTKLTDISAFVPHITDWAVCDTFCSSIAIPKNEMKNFYDYLTPYLFCDKEFSVRFGVVMLLQNYVRDDFIENILSSLQHIRNTQYYVQMAVAWALSVCYIKYPQQILTIFQKKSLDKFVQNKAIQKCCESLRISDEAKRQLRQYKR